MYWQENKKEVIRSDFEVKELDNYIHETVLYTKKEDKNYFSVTTGINYDESNYQEVQNEQLLLKLDNSWKNEGQTNYNEIKSLYMNNEDPRPGLPLKFRRVTEENVIKFIKGESEVNANNEKITLEKMVKLGYNLNAKESTVMRFKLNDEDYNNGAGGGAYEATKEGGITAVIVRKSNKAGEDQSVLGIGFVELVKVNRGKTDTDINGDARETSWKIKTYFPKDILENINQVIRHDNSNF